jgi:hypothetical protein
MNITIVVTVIDLALARRHHRRSPSYYIIIIVLFLLYYCIAGMGASAVAVIELDLARRRPCCP